METGERFFAKRYDNKDQICENQAKTNIIINVCSRPKRDYYHLIQPYTKPCYNLKPCDEPIDLTQGPNRVIKSEESEPTTSKLITKPKGRRPKIYCQNNIPDQNELHSFFKDAIEFQATETKQAEILKAAKSLFSKRTRTLYHWMYPNTPKQQIKLAVANSWDNLGIQEKQFYISQVLVRFGFPQCNLMVNPQLGGIKELPPLPDSIDGSTYSAKELQTALSSISNSEASSSATESKRRQGRPPGSKNKKTKNEILTYKLTKDFQDDPELSKELEKFAISFDCFK
ncbi:uncharacterized protein BDFB_001763 [Asbolus verrucosus]|uniref:Uncharacterized protein n=1 Tax=Asbolus verrucosus TaxID=1661398 RepID=A0A482VU15_ASBVE|nr:uncharacterized protein BDFB_001763 [Asbolus verrucosus]